ncbi:MULTISPECIES: hypothetical protein [unclassified Streptomyces]|uniref:hypothetical protein n=1 Tax=unclassified Streptomyces TaxID=2593676 RepID=UPI0012FF3E43|nr:MULTISPECIES: hypothetical protein [unclassified Streptomyces]
MIARLLRLPDDADAELVRRSGADRFCPLGEVGFRESEERAVDGVGLRRVLEPPGG